MQFVFHFVFYLQASFGCSLNICLKEVNILLRSGAPTGAAMQVHSLPMKRRKGLAWDIF